MTPSWIPRIGLAFILSIILLIGTQLPSSAAWAQASVTVLDFESPSLGGAASQIIDPYTASGVTFSAIQGGFGDEVVGLTTNAHTTVCVPEPSAEQLLGTGREASGVGSIGRGGVLSQILVHR